MVEFAVNDEGDETQGVSFESLVMKILQAENAPAVLLNFAVFMNDWNLQIDCSQLVSAMNCRWLV